MNFLKNVKKSRFFTGLFLLCFYAFDESISGDKFREGAVLAVYLVSNKIMLCIILYYLCMSEM